MNPGGLETRQSWGDAGLGECRSPWTRSMCEGCNIPCARSIPGSPTAPTRATQDVSPPVRPGVTGLQHHPQPASTGVRQLRGACASPRRGSGAGVARSWRLSSTPVVRGRSILPCAPRGRISAKAAESLGNLARSPGHRSQPPAVPAGPPALPGLPADGSHVCSHVGSFLQPRSCIAPGMRLQPAWSTQLRLQKALGSVRPRWCCHRGTARQ